MSAFVDLVRPRAKVAGWVFDVGCVVIGSVLLALTAQVQIPLGFTPVPITLHTFTILLLGGALGWKRGTAAILAYLVEGGLGLPVFSGFRAGSSILFGSCMGYFAGWLFTPYVMSLFLDRGWKERYSLTFCAGLIGSVPILLFGGLWLGFFLGWERALPWGVYPFLIGDVLKAAGAAALIPTGWKLVHRFQ